MVTMKQVCIARQAGWLLRMMCARRDYPTMHPVSTLLYAVMTSGRGFAAILLAQVAFTPIVHVEQGSMCSLPPPPTHALPW